MNRFDRLLKEVQHIFFLKYVQSIREPRKLFWWNLSMTMNGMVTGRLSNNLLVHFPGDEKADRYIGKCLSG